MEEDRVVREADLVERFDVPSIWRELEVADDGGWNRRESVSECVTVGSQSGFFTFQDVGAVDAQLVFACADEGFETE